MSQIRVEINQELINQTLATGQRANAAIRQALDQAIDHFFDRPCRTTYPVIDEDGRAERGEVRILVPEPNNIYKVWRATLPPDIDHIFYRWADGDHARPIQFMLTLHARRVATPRMG